MKSYFFITCLFAFFTANSIAQQGRIEERIRAAKVAFITDKLQLSVEESQNFWPVYNEMENKIEGIRKSAKGTSKIELMADAELDAHLMKNLNAKKQEVDVTIEYYQKLKNVIPIRKLAMLPGVENAFKGEILKKMQEERRKNFQDRMRNN